MKILSVGKKWNSYHLCSRKGGNGSTALVYPLSGIKYLYSINSSDFAKKQLSNLPINQF
uniref:Uncharacterized protein n=1 Tax=Podoviridae sp. ctxqo3 TaxID=2827755 RepID=A0A8S5SZW4_9CAUD|nr:MAG TPA: hypothetical protein [Podoviridae sp. ctxqo3]